MFESLDQVCLLPTIPRSKFSCGTHVCMRIDELDWEENRPDQSSQTFDGYARKICSLIEDVRSNI